MKPRIRVKAISQFVQAPLHEYAPAAVTAPSQPRAVAGATIPEAGMCGFDLPDWENA
jgi:hypothetical protein